MRKKKYAFKLNGFSQAKSSRKEKPQKSQSEVETHVPSIQGSTYART